MSESAENFSIQVDIDVLAAARIVALPHKARHDMGLLIKTVLTEAFGGAAVRPWTLHRQAGSVATILGYSAIPIADLEMRLAMALPAIRSAIKGLYGHALPVLNVGQKFRFSIRLCPTIRITPAKDKSHPHGEIDAFLVAVQRGETNIDREGVYSRYLTERLTGATLDGVKLTKFQLEQLSRPHRGSSAPPSGFAERTLPDCVLEGILTVSDPKLFLQLLMRGIGRQRAFGRGYVRLEPLRLFATA